MLELDSLASCNTTRDGVYDGRSMKGGLVQHERCGGFQNWAERCIIELQGKGRLEGRARWPRAILQLSTHPGPASVAPLQSALFVADTAGLGKLVSLSLGVQPSHPPCAAIRRYERWLQRCCWREAGLLGLLAIKLGGHPSWRGRLRVSPTPDSLTSLTSTERKTLG